MTYRAIPHPRVLPTLHRLPDPAMDELVELLAKICESPYDLEHSQPVRTDPRYRIAVLGDPDHDIDHGFIEIDVNDAVRLVTLTELIWVG